MNGKFKKNLIWKNSKISPGPSRSSQRSSKPFKNDPGLLNPTDF